MHFVWYHRLHISQATMKLLSSEYFFLQIQCLRPDLKPNELCSSTLSLDHILVNSLLYSLTDGDRRATSFQCSVLNKVKLLFILIFWYISDIISDFLWINGNRRFWWIQIRIVCFLFFITFKSFLRYFWFCIYG